MSLLCPSCKADLVMTERQGVEIDYCPKCRGVWLDRGELDKILERADGGAPRASAPAALNTSLFGGRATDMQAPPAPPPQHYQQQRRDWDDDDDDRHRGQQKPYKRKSWLSDIFD